MKNTILIFAMFFGLLLSLNSCKDKAKEAETSEAEEVAVEQETAIKYVTIPAETTITWTGHKPTGSHTGTIKVSKGELSLENGDIQSGNFTIDMASLKDSENNAKLEKHLKSADFFEVETYPNATFEITDMDSTADKSMISGNLTLKDTSNNISFPIAVATSGDTLTVTSDKFTIDRSKWNVKFQSKSFYDDLGDKFIDDDIELTIVMKAKKS